MPPPLLCHLRPPQYCVTYAPPLPPQYCVMERRTNKQRLHDPKQPLEQRLMTWEGPLWMTDYCQLPPGVLPQRLSVLCSNIAHHLQEVSQGHVVIARMQLFFKIDRENR